MSKRNISPCEFAALVRRAQALRQQMSQVESATQACRVNGIHSDWAIPLLSFINDAPASAEAWADRMFNEALDRAYARMETQP